MIQKYNKHRNLLKENASDDFISYIDSLGLTGEEKLKIIKLARKWVDFESGYHTPHKPFKDEYGNTDWRDTGEMGG